jgi:hypothetical protein
MKVELAEHSIYTIVSLKKIEKAAAKGGPSLFTEKKPWVSGFMLWKKAWDESIGMPVIFSAAEDCSQLIYWGILTKVRHVAAGTEYIVDQITKIKGKHTPLELVLKSTRKNIAPGFIRPYAICMTPSFIGSMPDKKSATGNPLATETHELNTLVMNIKREFFASILAIPSRKNIEYRELSPYWMSRLEKVGPAPFNLRLLNGMLPPVPEAIIRVERVEFNRNNNEIELHLGEVLQVTNWNRKLEIPAT